MCKSSYCFYKQFRSGRLILDLRHVNSFVEKHKIKFEGCKQALSYAHKGNKMVKFDLKSGYFHIDIHETYHQYLGFSWIVNNTTKFYVSYCFTFRFKHSRSCFHQDFATLSKTLAFLWVSNYPIFRWRLGVTRRRNLSYCQQNCSAKHVVNNQKSIWEPTGRLEWLGFIWDLEKGSVEIPEKKFVCLKEGLVSLIQGKERCELEI